MTGPPRVSVVLVAFNQEAYVEEAVASILAQDYPNLQVVLSDDRSSDRTYELMREAHARYDGPHTVVLNRTDGGRGVLQHFYHALRRCDGELMVGAAGDDVSVADRVTRLVERWRGTGAAGIYSAWNRVDAAGRFLVREGIEQQHDRDMAAYFPDREVTIAFGCTAAYEVAFLRSIAVPAAPIFSEDYFWSAVAMLLGRDIAYLDEALVAYRQHPRAQRNFTTAVVEHEQYEHRDSGFFAHLAELMRELLVVADGLPAGASAMARGPALADIEWYRYRAEWAGRGLWQRLRYVATLRSRQRWRWAAPRVLGLRPFLRAKRALAPLRRSRR